MRLVPTLFLAVPVFAHAAPYVSDSGFLKFSRSDYELSAVKTACPAHELTVSHSEQHWKVAKFSKVVTVANKTYYHLLCRGVDLDEGTPKAAPPMDNVASFLFVSELESGKVHLVWADTAENFGSQWYEAAEAKKNRAGDRFLRLPNPAGGNAGFNGDVLFLITADGAKKVDTATWKKEVRAQLPKGLILWNDLVPDLHKMTFESSLWRDGIDSHASPSGGSLHGTLGLKHGKLAVTSVEFDTTAN